MKNGSKWLGFLSIFCKGGCSAIAVSFVVVAADNTDVDVCARCCKCTDFAVFVVDAAAFNPFVSKTLPFVCKTLTFASKT